MSKIICDVCGTTYPDTASQCPICGTAKNDRSKTFSSNEGDGYAYVKGGRFSRSNVKKRSSGQELPRAKASTAASATAGTSAPEVKEKPVEKPVRERKPAEKPIEKPVEKPVEKSREPSQNKKSNLVLILLVILLLLSIVFICYYIANRYLELWGQEDTKPQGTKPSIVETTGPMQGVRIPCSAISLPESVFTMSSEDGTKLLQLTVLPANTTDEVIFASSDESILTVDDEGILTVVASGEAVVTITCGEQVLECTVTCVYVDPTQPTEPPEPTEPEGELVFVNANNEKNPVDVTFTKYGEKFQLYAGTVDASLVTFTSSDSNVVKVDAAGMIEIVGKGTATITAECGSKKVQCKIICSKVEVPVETSYMISYSGEDPTMGDITIAVGESQPVRLLDKETKAPVKGLNWYLSMEGYVEIKITDTGVRVTGLQVTGPGVYYVRVMCEYEGVTYTCKIRVKAAS